MAQVGGARDGIKGTRCVLAEAHAVPLDQAVLQVAQQTYQCMLLLGGCVIVVLTYPYIYVHTGYGAAAGQAGLYRHVCAVHHVSHA